MWDLLFSPNGRLNRAAFWKGSAIVLGIGIGVALAAFLLSRLIPGQPTQDGTYKVEGVAAIPYLILVFGYLAFAFWVGICLGIKRFHDRGKAGAWVLIQFVPLVGPVWYFVEAGCLQGTMGANTYGVDPRGGAGLLSATTVF